jgi:DNA repair exonuclease SbcCD ATPase subunit
MKKFTFGIPAAMLAAALFTAGCGESRNEEAEILRTENQSLKQELVQKDQSVSEFMETFNEIEENLLTIQNKERKITSGEISGGDVKNRIKAEIDDINKLLIENKELVASLQGKIKRSNGKMADFEKTIARLNESIMAKDAEILSLNDQLVAYNYKVEALSRSSDSLRSDIVAKATTIEQKDNQLNQVYYVVGTKKQLIKAGILDRKGDFSGRPGLKVNYATKAFQPADARQLAEIDLNGKRPKVLTGHPKGSFEVTNQKLVIKDAGDFWKANNYCVVQVN